MSATASGWVDSSCNTLLFKCCPLAEIRVQISRSVGRQRSSSHRSDTYPEDRILEFDTTAMADSRRRDCHSTAPPSTISRCLFMDKKGVSKMTVSPTANGGRQKLSTEFALESAKTPVLWIWASICRAGPQNCETWDKLKYRGGGFVFPLCPAPGQHAAKPSWHT